MKHQHTLLRLFLSLTFLVGLLPLSPDAEGRTAMINNASQLSSDFTQSGSLANLLNTNSNSIWATNDHDTEQKRLHNLVVDLGVGKYIGRGDCFIVETIRTNNDLHQPTAFRIEGSNDKTNWTIFAHCYFTYRGHGTKEYTCRLYTDEEHEGHDQGGTYRYLRFTCLATNQHYCIPRVRATEPEIDKGKEISSFQMAYFQIWKMDSDTEDYEPKGTNSRKDRFRYHSDYVDLPSTFRFEHTHGWADSKMRIENEQKTFFDKAKFNADGVWDGNDADDKMWEELGSEDLPEYDRIYKPDLHYLTGDPSAKGTKYYDPDISPTGGLLAHAPVMEHVLYAVPGDIICLYPYYDIISSRANYYPQFVHWYDYYTGEGHENLDFLIDASNVVRSPKDGYFGGLDAVRSYSDDGKLNPPPSNFSHFVSAATGESHNGTDFGTQSMIATFFETRNHKAAEGKMENLQFIGQNGRKEYVFACDIAQYFNPAYYSGNTLSEPPIHIRHIFRIKDGKEWADENTSTYEKNQAYIARTVKYVSAPAGKNFQIRLDSPVPASKKIRSKWYYKVKDDETEYRRVCSMEIEATDEDGNPVTGFTFGNPFNGYGSRTVQETRDGATWWGGAGNIDITYSACGGGDQYYRFIMCDKSVATAGKTYTVKIFGHDSDGNKIHFSGDAEMYPDKFLEIQEYRITFMPDVSSDGKGPSASVVDFLTLMEKNSKYKDRQPDNLHKLGVLKDCINFDQYAELLKKTNDYTDNNPYFHKYKDGYRLRYPLAFDNISYAFGYSRSYDYSNYVVANHSDATVYHGGYDRRGIPGHDVLYELTVGKESGFFFYLNACTDPGVMNKLHLKGFCPGATIHVSAWYNEFNNNIEAANLAFNFVAVLDDKHNNLRVPIHSFVSGYIDQDITNENKNTNWQQRAKWWNIYYSFNPDMDHLDKDIFRAIDHYEIELDNNCKSSVGADYAIDDIRVYITQPEVEVKQTKPLCEGTDECHLKVSSPYEMLLKSCAITEKTGTAKGTQHDLYYAFIDKVVYEQTYAEEEKRLKALEAAGVKDDDDEYKNILKDIKKKAFKNSVMKFKYSGETQETNYGLLHFSDNFADHKDYPGEDDFSQTVFKATENGTNYIVFNACPTSPRILPGRDYYIIFWHKVGTDDDITPNNAHLKFDPCDACGMIETFSLRSAGAQIKLDGLPVEPNSPIEVCEGQSPVVQLDVAARLQLSDGSVDKDKDPEHVITNAYFDWYADGVDKFNAEQLDGVSLRQMLANLRAVDTKCTDLELVQPAKDLTKEQIAYMKALVKAKKLYLHQSSYIFPPVKLEKDETLSFVHVVAVPFDYEDDTYLVCTSPSEITVGVRNRAPWLRRGFPTGITYPEDMVDVPVRIGLNEVKGVRATIPAERNTLTVADDMMEMPIRVVTTISEGASALIKMAEDRAVYLIATDDPEYQELGYDENNKGLFAVGQLVDLTAKRVNDGYKNNVDLVFDKTFNFKEGYTYKFRYSFKEDIYEGKDAEGNDKEETMKNKGICPGQDVFTIKIVPEYMRWVAKKEGKDSDGNDLFNSNWANDANWQRVAATEINKAADHDLPEFFTDQLQSDGKTLVNDRVRGFVPMDFTKVIVDRADDAAELIDGGLQENFDVGTGKMDWSSKPEGTTTPVAVDFEPTNEIQFDMAARSHATEGPHPGTKFIDCRPWLDNECDQIHFRDRAEIGQQKHLRYNKAHVEIELEPSRWYTLASPLQVTVAGDMYMPTDGARQMTEYFQPINFDMDKGYDRFHPAVYQRSWNRANALVHEWLPNPGTKTRDVMIETNWSHVYNEGNDTYEAGKGFSIKTDGSSYTHKKDENKKDLPALLRLPKDDTEYTYFTSDKQDKDEKVNIIRTDADGNSAVGRMNPVEGTFTVHAKTDDNKYFLVGNPFMCHLDIKAFLEANSGVVLPKYWIMTAGVQNTPGTWEGSQNAAVMTGDNVISTFTGNAQYVGPMQGFFVEAKTAGTSLSMKYTEGMGVTRNSDHPNHIKAPSRGGEPWMTVTLSNKDGDEMGRAIVVMNSMASRGYDPAEDAALILDNVLADNARVYVAYQGENCDGDVEPMAALATQIAQTPDAAGLEIGLRTPGGEGRHTLRFTGVDNLWSALAGELMLLDAEDGSVTPLEEGMEIEVDGDARGRFFVVTSAPAVEADALQLHLVGRTLTAVSTCAEGQIELAIYDTVGREMGRYTADGPSLSIELEQGIWIAEARDGAAAKKLNRKFIVR